MNNKDLPLQNVSPVHETPQTIGEEKEFRLITPATSVFLGTAPSNDITLDLPHDFNERAPSVNPFRNDRSTINDPRASR